MRLTINGKLVALSVLPLILGLGLSVGIASRSFMEDNRALVRQLAAEEARATASQVRERLMTAIAESAKTEGTPTRCNSLEAALVNGALEFCSSDGVLVKVNPKTVLGDLLQTPGPSVWLLDAQQRTVLGHGGLDSSASRNFDGVSIEYETQVKGGQLIAARKIGLGGLVILVSIPSAVAFEVAFRATRIALGLALLIAGLSVGLCIFLGLRWTKPIRTLARASLAVAHGDFTPVELPPARDEVGELSKNFAAMIQGLRERENYKSILNKFHDPRVIDELSRNGPKLGGGKAEVVVLFCDLRGFTALSEKVGAQETVRVLNQYFDRMVAAVRSHSGVIDKFIGDAFLAVWGLPTAQGDDYSNAIRCAQSIRVALSELNQQRQALGLDDLKNGMGIASGSVVAGNIGSNERMEYTVVGDPINIASRLEELTKQYGTDLLVTDVVAKRIEHIFSVKSLGEVSLQGRKVPVQIASIEP